MSDDERGGSQVFTADTEGKFDIEIGRRFSQFGPVSCPQCNEHMRTATIEPDLRVFILKCPSGHEKREIGFVCM